MSGCDRPMRWARGFAAAVAATYVLSLAAHALGAAGALATLAVGGKVVFLLGLVVLLVWRALLTREDRAAWLCFAGAVAAYSVGAAGYEMARRLGPVVARPAWFDVGFMGFYPVGVAALPPAPLPGAAADGRHVAGRRR